MNKDWQIKPGDRFSHPKRATVRPLRRVLRAPHLFSIAYGNVGSSIYYALGLVALVAAGATPAALGLAGLIFVFTALTYAEGTAMFPEAGGSASFARHGFNNFAGFMAGWSLMFGYIVTIAISSFAIPSYLALFWPPLKLSPVLMTASAMVIVIFLATINVIGVRESSRLSIALTVVDLATQLILIVAAALFFFNPQLIFERITNYWPRPQDFLYGIAIAAIAFTGIETVSQMAEETKRPQVNAPRAFIWITVVVLIVFAGISFSAFATMSPDELGHQWATDPIAGIAHKISSNIIPAQLAEAYFQEPAQKIVFTWAMTSFQAFLPVLVAVLAATILLVATNAGLLGISRLAFSLSRFNLIPPIIGKVHPRLKTPYIAIIGFSSLALLLQSPGFFAPDMYSNLGGLYAFGCMMSFAIAHASIISLRIKMPAAERPFKLGLNLKVRNYELPLTAILGFIGTTAIWFILIIMQPYTRWVGFVWIILGLILYWYTHRPSKLGHNKLDTQTQA